MNIQFKKGVLELCVLSLLYSGDRYGYDLVEIISKDISISEGTIYPMLRKFNQEGLVSTYLKESSSGPPRKYYHLSETGIKKFEESKKEWEQLIVSVKKILGGKDE